MFGAKLCQFGFSWYKDGPILTIYSVMQSDGNSSYGDVVLESFNKAYRVKDSILHQKYEKLIFLDLYSEDFNFNVY